MSKLFIHYQLKLNWALKFESNTWNCKHMQIYHHISHYHSMAIFNGFVNQNQPSKVIPVYAEFSADLKTQSSVADLA